VSGLSVWSFEKGRCGAEAMVTYVAGLVLGWLLGGSHLLVGGLRLLELDGLHVGHCDLWVGRKVCEAMRLSC